MNVVMALVALGSLIGVALILERIRRMDEIDDRRRMYAGARPDPTEAWIAREVAGIDAEWRAVADVMRGES